MYLCIDIGGTKTLVALMNDQREIVRSNRFPTERDQAEFLQKLQEDISKLSPPQDLRAISIAAPCCVRNNLILHPANLPWKNFNLVSELKKSFDTPIFIENDASLASIAETEKFHGLSIYFTFSTGIGGGITRDGHLLPESATYEPGHVKYNFDGQHTEWEHFASARAISQHFGKLSHDLTSSSDWQEIARRLSIGISDAISSLRPDHIVLGGPIGLELEKYRTFLIEDLTNALPPDITLPPITPAKYQHNSVLYGCLIYAQQQLSH